MTHPKYGFAECVEIIRRLRSENGCPWDNEQTIHSLRKYFLEETYEALDAMDRMDYADMKEELGDVLWEVLFVARIAEQEGQFAMEDIAQVLGEKMVRRHPHIFGEEANLTSEEVVQQWDAMKKVERRTDKTHHILDKVPESLPSVLRAFRISERAAKAGFDWDNPAQVLDKMHEELDEVAQAQAGGDPDELEEEFGDLMFAMVNYARHLHVSPEDALRRATAKFIRRFSRLEDSLHAAGEDFAGKTLDELEALWRRTKDAS
ncbi:nucleoside triphosphate pyrophosphohydrolase [bacterium]|nr:nucleoside triphosphate pyrophosphohydrolase [bacterium]